MTYTRTFAPCFLLLGFTLCAPFAAQSGSIVVNGTCEAGCTAQPALSDGMSTDITFDFNYSFVDGDTYNISGSYDASYSSADGSTLGVYPVITYIGSSPSVGDDIIDLTAYQDYFDPSCCTWAGTYSETVPLSLASTAGPGSTISGQVLYDGQSVGLVGPFGPGNYLVSTSANLDFGALDTDPTLSAVFQLDAQFDAGTLPEASAASSAPEPPTALPCVVGLILIAYGARARRGGSRVAL